MDNSLLRQIASFLGVLLILMASAGPQFHWMVVRTVSYKILNGLGSATVADIAFHPLPLGFVLLEVAWTAISLYALARAWKTR